MQKTGEPFWKTIIPFYGTYTLYKKTYDIDAYALVIMCDAGLVIMFPAFFGTSLAAKLLADLLLLIIYVIKLFQNISMAKVFGKNAGFATGLIFLTPIFTAILAFGKATYTAPVVNTKTQAAVK